MEPTTIVKRESENTLQPEQTRSAPRYIPPVDILESEEELLLVADVPGARADDIDIHYERGLLTLTAHVPERQDEQNANFVLREYGVGDFGRTFQIGEGIDADKIRAEVANGTLTLHLPKAEALKPRKIAVSTLD